MHIITLLVYFLFFATIVAAYVITNSLWVFWLLLFTPTVEINTKKW